MGNAETREPLYDMFARIHDNSPLAEVFNTVFTKLNTVRMIAAPRKFEGLYEESQCRFVYIFYESCLWELYLHGVIARLNEWQKALNEYFSDFEGNWKYYAAAKRIDCINMHGGEEQDYNEDGSVRTAGITDEELECYTILHDLVNDDRTDIVQETKPDELQNLGSVLETSADISITDIIKDTCGVNIPMYRKDEHGNMVQLSFAERVLLKTEGQLQAGDLSLFVVAICQTIQSLLKKIRGLNKFKDNQVELKSILKVVEHLLDADVERIKKDVSN